MANRRSILTELKRRNVWRPGALYAGAAWALAQGIAQIGPLFGMPDWGTRWFVVACVIGFPFWIAFAWFYELTPEGFKREDEVPENAPARRSSTRKLDLAIIGVLIVAVTLLGSGYFIHREAPVEAIPLKSIAVLPFQNLSNDSKNAYFVAGMQDLILTRLSDISDLKVISRTSTMRYESRPGNLKQIAAELGVATILEGSVQKAGNEVLINVQLIDAKSDAHLWGETYRRTLEDIFGVEGEVAQTIASALHAELSPAQSAKLAVVPTTNQAAYDLFLRAEYLFNRGDLNYDVEDWKAAIPLYQEAVARDPGFALAWARLAINEGRLAGFGGAGETPEQRVAEARADAKHALQLAPDLATAHNALGWSHFYTWIYMDRPEFTAALKAFDAALALRPNDFRALTGRAIVQRRQGRRDAAIASFKQAIALDPRNSGLAYETGATYLEGGRFLEAEPWFQRALAIDPTNHNAKVGYARSIVHGRGDVVRALDAVQGDAHDLKLIRSSLLLYQRKYREAIALTASVPDNLFGGVDGKSMALADAYRLAGDAARARPLFEQVLAHYRGEPARRQGMSVAYAWLNIATCELGLGHTAKGLDAVARALAVIEGGNPAAAGIYVPGGAGSYVIATSASLYAETGRPDLAVPLLAKVLASPDSAGRYQPVMLWLDPHWDAIRHDPGFQALLQKYAEYKPAITYDAAPAAGASSASQGPG